MGIVERFHEGGIFMYFILAFGIMTFALIAERITNLYFKVKEVPAEFRKKVLEYVVRGDFKGAEDYASLVGAQSGIGRVIVTGCKIRSNGGGEEELQARMDEKLSSEISLIDRRTGFLAMFGNVATLLGLLGTIVGMIHSFAAVATANPADRATMLSKGISEAMNCTAFGLIVAIPALVSFAFFQNKTDRLVTELTEVSTQIYHDLLFLSESEQLTTRLSKQETVGKTVSSTPSMSM
jgi:biopolymer transport protein ExbB/TolQ